MHFFMLQTVGYHTSFVVFAAGNGYIIISMTVFQKMTTNVSVLFYTNFAYIFNFEKVQPDVRLYMCHFDASL